MRGILLVISDAVAGEDQAFNEWYDNVHLDDVLSVPGIVAARRFVAVPSVHGELPDARYVAIYEIEAEDLDAVQQALSRAAATMEISRALDRSNTVTYTYRLLTETAADD
jgi:hypothetical protein